MDDLTWPYELRRGHSDDPSKGACAMDAVNWLVHGRHGDAPACASPVIGSFVQAGNDALPDDQRQRLLPYLHRIAGSRSMLHEGARLKILVRAAGLKFAPAAQNAEYFLWRSPAGAPAAVSLRCSVKTDVIGAVEAGLGGVLVRQCASAALGAAKAASHVLSITVPYCTWWTSVAVAHHAGIAAATAIRGTMAAKLLGAEVDAASVYDTYFAVLDEALEAGPQGEPWSAVAIDEAACLYRAAGGLVTA